MAYNGKKKHVENHNNEIPLSLYYVQPSNDLDALVAKRVMGWEQDMDEGGDYIWKDKDGRQTYFDAYEAGRTLEECFSPSRKLADAELAWETLRQAIDFKIELKLIGMGPNSERKATYCIDQEHVYGRYNTDIIATGDTPELAMTKAMLFLLLNREHPRIEHAEETVKTGFLVPAKNS